MFTLSTVFDEKIKLDLLKFWGLKCSEQGAVELKDAERVDSLFNREAVGDEED